MAHNLSIWVSGGSLSYGESTRSGGRGRIGIGLKSGGGGFHTVAHSSAVNVRGRITLPFSHSNESSCVLSTSTIPALEQPPSTEVMDRLRQGLNTALAPNVDADTALQLAEAVRVLALRHGPAAVRHCISVIRSLRDMLDDVTGIA